MIEIKFKIEATDRINISHETNKKHPTELEASLAKMFIANNTKFFHKLAETLNKLTIEEANETK